MKDAIAGYCILNSAPFNTIEKEGFRSIISAAMEIGASRRSVVDLNSLLVTRMTISNAVAEKASKLHEVLAPKIVEIATKQG